jgi:metacaspase-1
VTKRALCIGTNYAGTSSQLAGCVNDARDWSSVLERRDFQTGRLLDNFATRANMLEGMSDLIEETGPDDLAVITYSGHGSWQPDRSGDEPDRRDEVLCPVDYARAGMISDDDLYRVFTSGHRWARVVMISDSCHSGSVNRLAGPLTTPGDAVVQALTDRAVGSGVQFEAVPPRRAKFLPPAAWMPTDQVDVARRVELVPSRGRPRASALLLAACTDQQVAYDAWFDGRANGAFTYAALQALAEQPATYRDWQRAINRRLPSVDYDQAPRLEGGSGQRRWLVLEAEGER